jgi:signal transduction histidine kinase
MVTAGGITVTTEQLVRTLFLIALVIFFGYFVVQLDRGSLRLTMIGTQAAGMLLVPAMAGVVGLVAGLSWIRHGPKGRRYLGIGATVFWTASASFIRSSIGDSSQGDVAAGFAAVALWMTLVNWIHTLVGLSILSGDPVRKIADKAMTRPFFMAFLYFSLAAVVIAYLVDGSVRGYVLAVVVALLSVTLTESLAERRTRAVLEAQVADSQRHVGYSRAMEGVAHSLRHQLAISKGYLEDVLEARLAAQPRERTQAAKTSTDAALQILDRLSASASPKVQIGDKPVNLRDVATASVDLVHGRAEGQGTRLLVVGKSRGVQVSGDPVLLREVVTELLINGLDAVGNGGSATVSVGKRRGGWGSLSVADTGPGIPESQREHLFEPHFTTKPAGTGMGLFTAFGVLREHGGKLIYEGGPKRGGVFTILVPTAGESVDVHKTVAVTGDGLDPSMVAKRLPG